MAAYYLRKTLSIFSAFVLVVFFLRFFFIDSGKVDGQSMEPTFRNNTLFLTNKIGLLVSPPNRFDVVQFMSPQDQRHLTIKRVVGLPGETVIFKRNAVYVRDRAGAEHSLTEPYLYPDLSIGVTYGSPHEFTIPPDSYFLLGDNRPTSADSREYGPVHRRNIIGTIFSL